MANDAFGREHLSAAWLGVFGETPALHELQLVQGVARLESGYGRGQYRNKVTGEVAVLNNWGATQCGHGPPCGSNCFEVTDTHADGSPYNWCYHRFSTPEEGASHYLKTISRIVARSQLGWNGALASRSSDTFVRSMKEGGYFELALEKYQERVWNSINAIAQSLGEEVAVVREEGVVPADGGSEESPDARPLSQDLPDTPRSPTDSDGGLSADDEDEVYGCD